MIDDRILREIGKALSEPDALDDPRWERLRQGLADEAQKKELVDLEKRSPHIRGASDAYQPLESEFKTRLQDLIKNAETSRDDDSVISLRARNRRKNRGAILAGAIAAMAAAAALFLVLPSEPPPEIADYSYEFSGGEQKIRGSELPRADEIPSFTSSSLLEMRLRPESSAANTVRVTGFLVGGGKTRELELPFLVSSSGVITVRGRVSDLFRVNPGEYNLVVIVTGDETQAPRPELPLTPGVRRVKKERFEIVQPLRILDNE